MVTAGQESLCWRWPRVQACALGSCANSGARKGSGTESISPIEGGRGAPRCYTQKGGQLAREIVLEAPQKVGLGTCGLKERVETCGRQKHEQVQWFALEKGLGKTSQKCVWLRCLSLSALRISNGQGEKIGLKSHLRLLEVSSEIKCSPPSLPPRQTFIYIATMAVCSNCAYFYHQLWAVPCMETAYVFYLCPHDPKCEMVTLGFSLKFNDALLFLISTLITV